MRMLLAHFILLAQSASAASRPSAPPKDFLRNDLNKIFALSTIRSIPDLIKALPDEFAGNRMEFYDSNSLHCATFSAPRVVMFSESGELVCSYNSGREEDYREVVGKDCAETLNKVECMAWDPKKFEDRVFEIEFSPDHATQKERPRFREHGEIYQKKCSQCHLQHVRRIINPYFNWTGVYGSDDDSHLYNTDSQNTFEKAMFELYRSSKNPRYKNLPRYFQPPIDESDMSYRKDLNLHLRPNLKATRLFSGLHLKKLAQFFHSEPNLSRYRYALLGAGLCDMETKIVENQEALLDNFGEFLPPSRVPKQSFRDLLWDQFTDTRQLLDRYWDSHIALLGPVQPQERFAQERISHLVHMRDVKGLKAIADVDGVGFVFGYGHQSATADPIIPQSDLVYSRTRTLFHSRLRWIFASAGIDVIDWSTNFSGEFFFEPGFGERILRAWFSALVVQAFVEDVDLKDAIKDHLKMDLTENDAFAEDNAVFNFPKLSHVFSRLLLLGERSEQQKFCQALKSLSREALSGGP